MLLTLNKTAVYSTEETEVESANFSLSLKHIDLGSLDNSLAT